MILIEIAKKAEKLALDNSPAILTEIGVAGTLTTALLTGKATFRAAEILDKEVFERERRMWAKGQKVSYPEPTLKEKTFLVWKNYIPAVGTGAITVVCIIFANRIGTRRAAAVAAAYTISEKAFAEYKDKVVERLGMPKEQKIRDDVAQDRVDQNPVSKHDIIVSDGKEVLCYESFTGRYFKSDMETLKKGQNDLNYSILQDGYASLGDFYNKIDLPTTSYSEEVGWTSDKLLELEFSTCLSDDGKPCISVNFRVTPVRDYYKLG